MAHPVLAYLSQMSLLPEVSKTPTSLMMLDFNQE
jgi:hypothetical protein